jgi:hypothetical protein
MIVIRYCESCGMAYGISDNPLGVWQDRFCWECVKMIRKHTR